MYLLASMRLTYLTNLTVSYGILNRNAVYRRYLIGIMFDIAYWRLYETSYCSLCPFSTVFIILGQNYQLPCIFLIRIPGSLPRRRF